MPAPSPRPSAAATLELRFRDERDRVQFVLWLIARPNVEVEPVGCDYLTDADVIRVVAVPKHPGGA